MTTGGAAIPLTFDPSALTTTPDWNLSSCRCVSIPSRFVRPSWPSSPSWEVARRLPIGSGSGRNRCRPPPTCTALGETELGRSRYADARAAFQKIVERHPAIDLCAAGALPHRRGVLPRERVRQGDQGVRDVPVLLPPPPDRRPRAVPARHELLRPDEARRAGSGDHRRRPWTPSRSSSGTIPIAATPATRSRRSRSAAAALPRRSCGSRATTSNQGNTSAARQRLEGVIKEFPRTLVIPEALFRLGEVYSADGRTAGRAGAVPPRCRRVLLHRMGPPRGPAAPDRHEVSTPMHDVVDLRSDTLTLPTPADARGHGARRGRRRRLGGRSDRPAGSRSWRPGAWARRPRSSSRRAPRATSSRCSRRRSRARRSSSTRTRTSSTTRCAGAAIFGGVQTLAAQDRARLPRRPAQVREHIRPEQHPHPDDRPGLPREHAQPPRRHLLHAGGDRGGGRRGPRGRRARAPRRRAPLQRRRRARAARSRTSPAPSTRSPSACPRGWARPSARSCAARATSSPGPGGCARCSGGGMRQVGRARRGRPRGARHHGRASRRGPRATRAALAEGVAHAAAGSGSTWPSVQTNIVILPRGPRAAAPASWSPAAWRAR